VFILKRSFFSSFQGKVLFILFIFLSVPGITTWYTVRHITGSTLREEKSANLMRIALILEKRLVPGGYDELLREAGVESASREEKIRALNNALAGVTDEIASVSSRLGVGFYSRDLDAIITYGPSSEFAKTVGTPIAPDHPGREVMRTNNRRVVTGTMVRGKIMNAMLPIEREGRVIGYIWANELAGDIEKDFDVFAGNVFMIIIVSYLLAIAIVVLLSRKTFRDVEQIIGGLGKLRSDLSKRLEPAGGWLSGVVDSINAMAADISRANEGTERAVSVLQGIMGNLDAMVYVCDPGTKKLVYINAWLAALLKCGDIENQICYEALYGRNDPCPHCPHEHFFSADGTPDLSPVRREVHNDLVGRDFLATDRLVTWHDGRLLHLGIGTDITERKALIVAEAANSAQKEFLARMSHEIRTPMNGVLGMTHLAMQASPPPKQYEYLKKIQSSAKLLLGIINDILDFSKIEAGKLSIEKESFNIREMVENIRSLILPRTEEKGLDFVLNVADTVPERASGDELRLSQILLNLLGNAAKFTSLGSIELRISAEETPGAVRLDCAVEDSGLGITEEQRNALFKPFTQADSSTARKFGGTGLGLSISKALVELMGGEISVTSEPEQGSVFSFYVILDPASDEDSPGNIGAESADVRLDGKNILLAEDNEINQEIAVAILSELGADAEVADNGVEAVNAFLEKEYDLILMDIRMPLMDGLEATRLIRASGKERADVIPIIAMTANAMTEDKEECKNAGMDGHISKPIEIAELKSTLGQFLSDH
jgi:signal transduction histidine kinase/CheY-like chemotaxis protein